MSIKEKFVKIFIVEVEILEDNWFVLKGNKPLYRKGQKILIPIKTHSAYHAEMKFENNYWGGEFPDFRIVDIHKCDNGGLFAADRFKGINY